MFRRGKNQKQKYTLNTKEKNKKIIKYTKHNELINKHCKT
jgi:hypothetical protein